MIVCKGCGKLKLPAVGGFDIRAADHTSEEMRAKVLKLRVSTRLVYYCLACDGGPPAVYIDPQTGRPA